MPARRYLSGIFSIPLGVNGWRFEAGGTDGVTTPHGDPAAATKGIYNEGYVKLAYEALKRRDYELTVNARLDAANQKIDTLIVDPAVQSSCSLMLKCASTVLTILARGIAEQNAAKYMIDGFWNGDGSTSPGEGNTWPGPGHIDLLDKATFSDGAGHNATPTNDPAFPIAPGKTDFAALLNNGPVMIGASSDQRPVQWLLANSMAPDGKGIICDDTMTGKLVELSYDPATRTVGGITRLFDDKSKSFVPLADASNDIPASDASGLSGLQTFVPSTYFAVTVH
jgi:hypothetical protein